MNIVLCKNASPENKANKSITVVSTISGTLREDTSIVNPVFLVELDSVPTFNYVKVADFSRNYFVTDIISVAKKLWEIHCHCDVLTSFWSEIQSAECIISRSASNRNPLLIDKQLWVTGRSRYATIKSSNQPLTTGTASRRFVMILPGSGVGT